MQMNFRFATRIPMLLDVRKTDLPWSTYWGFIYLRLTLTSTLEGPLQTRGGTSSGT